MIINPTERILLCRGKGCCPTITKNKNVTDEFQIADDFGGVVRLSRDELLMLKDAENFVKQLDKRD